MSLSGQQTEALQESLRQWEIVFDGISDGICVLDADRKILKCNSAMAKILGKPVDQCVGAIICRLLHGSDDPVENCPLRKACQSGIRKSCELPVEDQQFQVTVDPLKDDKGKITRVVHIIRNITDRKRAEDALSESMSKYRALFDNAMDGISIYEEMPNHNRKLVEYNDRYVEMSGFSREELLNMPNVLCVQKFIGTSTHEGEIWRRRREHLSYRGEFAWLRPDGKESHIEFTAAHVSIKGKSLTMGIDRDITDRKRVEAELQKVHSQLEQRVKDRTKNLTEVNKNLSSEILQRRKVQEALGESERKFRTLAETISAAIMIVQGDQTVYTNRAMQQLTGRTREVLYKIPYWELSHPEWRDIIRSRCSDHQQGDDVISWHEGKILTASGEQRWVDQSMTTINYDGKQAILLTALDITQRHQAEEELKAAHVQLVNARERERKNLAAELHDSLAQEMVVLQMMMQHGQDMTGDRDKFAKWLSGAGKMCSTMIAKIRRICHGLYPPILETFGLRKSLENLSEFYKVANVKVKIKSGCKKGKRFSPDVEIALFRIAQEAMSNAIRHGGATKATIELCFKDGVLSEKIIDNGSGFDVNEKKSYGLGLRSMKDRANSIGGELKITSHPGETRVCVAVPTTPI